MDRQSNMISPRPRIVQQAAMLLRGAFPLLSLASRIEIRLGIIVLRPPLWNGICRLLKWYS